MKRLFIAATTALGVASLMLAATTPAQACGGFFCSQTPIDQMGEQIIFGVGDNSITAQIMISYTGEAEDFSWILPVATQPTLTVGSQAAFQTVASRTQPYFYLNWDYGNNQCGGWQFAPELASDADGGAGGNVEVIAEEEVGPFATTIIAANDTQALVTWLNDNGYDQPPESTPLIDHYVQQGMLFVALKLKRGEPVGAIQPIQLEFEEADPCVPLVLTQIAAVDDMPIQLYLLAEHRMVPTNWMHVVINQKKIDWINYGQNYTDVVTQAVNEARGHAFVTEYAGPSNILENALYNEGRYDLEALGATTDPARFVQMLLNQGFPRDATMQGLLRKYIPMPQSLIDQGVEERSFYNNLDSYAEALAELDFDAPAFVTELEERVIAPLRSAQELFDSKPYMTRLFTTVSPNEMNRDPLFAENADLGEVDNQHTADAMAVCNEDDPNIIDRVIITLEDGDVFELEGPFDNSYWWGGGGEDTIDPAPEESAAKRIELIGRSGPPTLVGASQVIAVDDSLDQKTSDQVIADMQTGVIPPATEVVVPPTPEVPGPEFGPGSGCTGGGAELPLFLVLAMLGMLAVVRRRQETNV
ncbi:MAG: MYXO-CTERM domain-containing protein [Myxococcota bacterium]